MILTALSLRVKKVKPRKHQKQNKTKVSQPDQDKKSQFYMFRLRRQILKDMNHDLHVTPAELGYDTSTAYSLV